MNNTSTTTWQSVKTEVVRRINQHIWQPGETLPRETDLAKEFGCTRATVNRAMQEIAKGGLIDRKRKAGTRVAKNPERVATLRIPVTRLEVEKRGAVHDFRVLKRQLALTTAEVRERLGDTTRKKHLHLITLHLADGQPFMLEDRWINIEVLPDAASVDFNAISSNEWLVRQAPFTEGDISFAAENANAYDAKHLAIHSGQAILCVTRTTRNHERSITTVRLAYAPGHEIHTTL